MRVLAAVAWILSLGVVPAALAQDPAPAQFLEVVRVVEDVEVQLPGQEWAGATAGQQLPQGTQVSTGPDSEIHLLFPDRSVMIVKAMTEVMVSTLLRQGNAFKAQVLLKIGEVSAQVNPTKVVSSDFSVATAVATASVRGTEINRIRFDPATGMTADLQEGKLLVETARGREMITGTSDARADGDLVTAREMIAGTRLARVTASGLTEAEQRQVRTVNRPAIDVPVLLDSVRGSVEEARIPRPPDPVPIPDPRTGDGKLGGLDR